MLEFVKAHGRKLAERRMTAACVVYRKTGALRDGARIKALWESVYTGRCEWMSRDEQSGTVGTEALATATRGVSQVRLPVGVFRPAVGDVVEITDSTDPLLVGTLLRITQPHPTGEHATAYRPYVTHLDGDYLADFEQAEVTA